MTYAQITVDVLMRAAYDQFFTADKSGSGEMAKNDVLQASAYIRKETRMNIVINLVLNAAIAYATLRGLSEVTTWGEHGYGKDLFITGFILCTILGGIFIAVPRRKYRQNLLVADGTDGISLNWLLPYSPWLAAPWMGLLGALIAAPLLLAVLSLFKVSSLSPLHYALIKGVWAAVLASIVVPVSIRQAMRPPSD